MKMVKYLFISISLVCFTQLSLSCPVEKNNTHWFGTFITCNSNSYTLDLAKIRCPSGQVLAEIMDASLYTNITQAISTRTE